MLFYIVNPSRHSNEIIHGKKQCIWFSDAEIGPQKTNELAKSMECMNLIGLSNLSWIYVLIWKSLPFLTGEIILELQNNANIFHSNLVI